ncbi:serine hydrolase [Chryseolinea sp. T2]|uniref:serine hydrolase n=1 Tax=Chryseolinea sp. T2 TaxID=3129255 RepID=UPI003077D5C4
MDELSQKFMPGSRRLSLLIAFIPFFMQVLLQGCQSDADLRRQIEKELSSVDGEFAVAFEDLTSGEQLLINERKHFHAASTMKTPVMIEVFKQAAAGKFSLKDSIEIRNSFSSIVDKSSYSLKVEDDSDTLIYRQIGQRRTIYDLVYDMIIQSSNLATNLVIELVGPDNVTATMRDYGANDIQVLRGVEDQKAFDKGLNNSITAFDQLLIMKKIALGEAVSKESSEAMMNILFNQRFREIIPARLPSDVKVADKRGWIKGLEHDCAIVLLPNGKKYVLILLSDKLADRNKAVGAMANVSRLIYDHVARE